MLSSMSRYENGIDYSSPYTRQNLYVCTCAPVSYSLQVSVYACVYLTINYSDQAYPSMLLASVYSLIHIAMHFVVYVLNR